MPLLRKYNDDRIELKVAREALGVVRRLDLGTETLITTVNDFERLHWYPPDDAETRQYLQTLVEIRDDAWPYLLRKPPGRVRVFITATDEEKMMGRLEFHL